ncbi:MAG: NAD(P)-binding domain-containing protein [Alphaproteobacteria bacterium]|nr:NAD(P)-binding domain-containing protein [Alphaproteobacteria bacterium]
MNQGLPVAVIGAGPVGLAAAAHLLERGLEPLVLEKGREVGSAIRQWGHVAMFSPWQYCIDAAALRLLEGAGWTAPDPARLPTGHELVEHYLEPLAALPVLRPRIRFGAEVISVGRLDMDKVRSGGREDAPFHVRLRDPAGGESALLARAVIDASGTWGRPNPLGSGGLPLAGEAELWRLGLLDHGIPDVRGARRADFAGRTTLVAGSGHSAINVVLDLLTLAGEVPGTRIVWALRRENIESVFGGGGADQLVARGQLGEAARRAVAADAVEVLAPFRAGAIQRTGTGRIRVEGRLGAAMQAREVDRVVVATGFRPDLDMLREVRLGLDSWLECPAALGPMIDPNLHSCGTVRPHGARELRHPEKDFYILGMKAYGRAPTFLLATGYEQARSVAAELAGDAQAAARVELILPETGVCGVTPKATAKAKVAVGAAACCG